MKHYDAVIIGFGKGGKTLAVELAKRGQHVAMVERSAGMYGGTCVNVACIPTKALIYQAKIAGYLKLGTFKEKAEFYRKAIEWKDGITTDLRKSNYDKLNHFPNTDIYTGVATFVSPREVEVTTETEKFRLGGEKFFIDTGASPVIPLIPGIRESYRIFTSTSLMQVNVLPERLVIIGSGYIGLEFASMYAGFGSKVVVLESASGILSREDPEVAKAVKKMLETKGIEFRLNVKVDSIGDTDEETVVGYTDTSDKTIHSLFADAVLVATGRQPEIESLNLGAVGVQVDGKGAILVNEYLQTTAPGIWALGDVKGGPQFTYVSLDDARIIQDQLFGEGKLTTAGRIPVPYTIYLDPPLSHVGMTEREAISKGLEVMTKTIPVATIPRTRIWGETDGLLKSVVEASTGKIIGCTLFCINSGEAINIVTVAIKAGLDYSFLRDRLYTHPSMSESMNALFDF